jgi:hypothetical protein
VQINAAGQVEFKHATPWRDGTTHLVMSRLEFMRRLAALVPRPRLHLTRFHGVLAPNAKLRALVVPQGPEVERQPAEAAPATECEPGPGDKQSGHLPVPGKGPGLPRGLTGAACAAEPVLGRSPGSRGRGSDREPGRCWASHACDAHGIRVNPESVAAYGFPEPTQTGPRSGGSRCLRCASGPSRLGICPVVPRGGGVQESHARLPSPTAGGSA